MTTPPDFEHLTADVLEFATLAQIAETLRSRGPFVLVVQASRSKPDVFVSGQRETLKALMAAADAAVERAKPARLATRDAEPPTWEGGTK